MEDMQKKLHDREMTTLEDYLLKDSKTNMSKVVPENTQGAKKAVLEYQVLDMDTDGKRAFLKVKLHTGRHHQIRVQLSNIGHSIFGDQKYGTRGQGKQIALWAYKLTIEHPITKEKMTFTDLPESIGTWCILKEINNL